MRRRTMSEAQAIAMRAWGPLAAVRETRGAGTRVRVCEVGFMDGKPEWWTRPMVVKGCGGSWHTAFEAAGVDADALEGDD